MWKKSARRPLRIQLPSSQSRSSSAFSMIRDKRWKDMAVLGVWKAIAVWIVSWLLIPSASSCIRLAWFTAVVKKDFWSDIAKGVVVIMGVFLFVLLPDKRVSFMVGGTWVVIMVLHQYFGSNFEIWALMLNNLKEVANTNCKLMATWLLFVTRKSSRSSFWMAKNPRYFTRCNSVRVVPGSYDWTDWWTTIDRKRQSYKVVAWDATVECSMDEKRLLVYCTPKVRYGQLLQKMPNFIRSVLLHY